MIKRIFVSVVVACVATPMFAGAQTWRTFDVARQARDSQPFSVHLAYGAGRVRVQPAPARTLYDVHVRYDAERAEPTYAFDAATRKLDVGVRQVSVKRNLKSGEGSELKLLLATTAPLRLSLDVGAAEGDFDLTGLRLVDLKLQTGATDTRVRFDAPNPERLQLMTFQVGAASIQVTGLGNANVERVEMNLGVGKAELDFSGEWRGDTEVAVNSALGSVTLRVPADVGIRIESSAFLHSIDAPGMLKRQGYSVSANWDSAKYKLRVHSSGALGELEIQRIAK